MTTEKSLRDTIKDNFEAVENAAPDEPDAPEEITEPDKPEEKIEVNDEADKAPSSLEADTEEKPVAPSIEAPQAWKGPMKEKWATLPPDVQAEIIRRENDMHKMVTASEGDLRLGRELKEVIAPYMPDISAQGVTPAKVVSDLLSTAKRLGSSDMGQRVAVLHEIARNYGVDLGQANPQPQDQIIYALQNKIQQLEQQVNPEAIGSLLKQQQETIEIQSNINAFAANPANKHFEKVRLIMKGLLESEQAADLQEAYDMACWSNPTIRSTMLEEAKAAEAAKRKDEMAAKKKAASSITGSPSSSSGNAKPSPERELRDEIAANIAVVTGSKI